MNLESILKITQIIFYLVAGTIAILTYLKAKRSFLNSVNTEYQKKALQKVEDISEFLISEFDKNSENYWAKAHWKERSPAQIMLKQFIENKEEFLKYDEWMGGTPSNPQIEKLNNWVNKIKSDPFVPKVIRKIVVDNLENRVNLARQIEEEELRGFGNKLVTDKGKSNLENLSSTIHNKINSRQYKEGIGISQIEEKVHNIRIQIQDYYEKYDPLK
ncbi:hypothetical protein [Tenacibaculum finnmarkense]|uniref:Uncharacterized protein n=1 Tax=Tenacibaculum finnmarkense genomovar finnmarkense TaxID=1458503 RepID=A0AAP1WHD3_9FLAO|nr:hypothetical protein [Tenacibaculum finnmarkense]MBE7653995.1 hypothetical protein [Tenacibaculum finnmarkense genomovar finnmarkense]MBE7696293.1 hypothetical protein [Tenacibaculum finnmarkense genomovar finnmarkense]MCD8428533.1 hypothetical protein [Tenacibaculum finnmarkense genomovar finnmarkense]MCG8732319.1 hypothetical protein [Tenacibaculum finnmarkense]MCG8753056.1 hypothetical protein [Tenacibaculum finnmarkense]